jgi:hypothetical protein
MELAEWLADRVRAPGIKTPLATLFARAIEGNDRTPLGTTWAETPIQTLGSWSGTKWQEVARLADLAANREAIGRLLVRRNPAASQAVNAMRDLLAATEETTSASAPAGNGFSRPPCAARASSSRWSRRSAPFG